jgi:NAD+ kinase
MSTGLVAVMSHGQIGELDGPLRELLAGASRAGARVVTGRDEPYAARFGAAGVGLVSSEELVTAELCVTLGGDGTILRALRTFSNTSVPVFAVNFGQVGFLATTEPVDLPNTFDAAFSGDFERLEVPSVTAEVSGRKLFAINDVTIQRANGGRVAELGYGVGNEVIGNVRCDGLVACTPVGSTGYNLANGGPIMAWGVEGYAVSFVSPHSLTARSIVVAPTDSLVVENRGNEPVEITLDGRHSGADLMPGDRLTLGYDHRTAVLAQLSGASFYRRLREKFGHLRT